MSRGPIDEEGICVSSSLDFHHASMELVVLAEPLRYQGFIAIANDSTEDL